MKGKVTLGLRPLRYLFYRVWQWKQLDPREQFPLLVATMTVTALLAFNILALIELSVLMSGYDWLYAIGRSRVSALALGVGLTFFFPLYECWVRRGGYRQIAQEFANEPLQERRRHTVYFWCYISATVVAPWIAAAAVRLCLGT